MSHGDSFLSSGAANILTINSLWAITVHLRQWLSNKLVTLVSCIIEPFKSLASIGNVCQGKQYYLTAEVPSRSESQTSRNQMLLPWLFCRLPPARKHCEIITRTIALNRRFRKHCNNLQQNHQHIGVCRP